MQGVDKMKQIQDFEQVSGDVQKIVTRLRLKRMQGAGVTYIRLLQVYGHILA